MTHIIVTTSDELEFDNVLLRIKNRHLVTQMIIKQSDELRYKEKKRQIKKDIMHLRASIRRTVKSRQL